MNLFEILVFTQLMLVISYLNKILKEHQRINRILVELMMYPLWVREKGYGTRKKRGEEDENNMYTK